MRPQAHPLLVRRAGRTADQGGYALLSVLAVIALTAVTIAALLGMLMTTIRVTSTQEQSARELRAADSALETAIAQMRRDPALSGMDPCALEAPVDALDAITFDQSTSGSGDDLTVDIDCSPAALGDPSATSDQVRLVGAGGYRGAIPWSTNCAVNALGPGCLPWTSATGSAAPGGLVPSLVHSGPQPLLFDSGVTARRGAAALRNPTDASPAVQTAGQYLQGDPGPGATGSQRCGILSPGGSAPAAVVSDLDGEPVCDSSDAANVDASPTDPVAGFAVTPGTPAVPPCSSGVVSIQPGRYVGANATSLRNLLRTCGPTTFHFLPGVLSVDLADGLEFASAGSYYVFGAAKGWNPATGVGGSAVANDPAEELCDTAVSGTSLIVSGRTEMVHTAGRVALCPTHSADPDQPYPAVYQETSVPTMTVSPTIALPRSFAFSCALGQPVCDGGNIARRTHIATINTTGARPLSSVRVLITGTEGDVTQNNLVSNRTTRIEVRRPAPDSSLICSTGELSGVPNAGLTSSFELRTGTCAAAIDNESDLVGTELRIRHSMQMASALVVQPLQITALAVQLNSATASATPAQVTSPSGHWNDVGNVAADDAALATPVMPCAFLACEVVRPTNLAVDNVFTHSMTLSDLNLALPPELAGSDVDANITDLRLLVKVEPTTASLPPGWILLNPQNFRPEMNVRIVLSTSSGQRCVVRPGFVNSRQELAFDLIGVDDATPGCDALLQTYSQLADVDVSLQMDLPCVRNPLAGQAWQCLSTGTAGNFTVLRVRPPSIQYVGLAAASDSYAGPPPTSQVTINAGSTASSSAFHSLGSVWLPLSDLDVRWRGAVADGRPLVAGDLVLNGLGSDMSPTAQAGSVCCTAGRPGSRTVTLTASIEGRPVLRMTVRFVDVDPAAPGGGPVPGFAVEVLEWATCDRSGLCAADPDGP